MNIFDFCERFHISQRKAREMMKAGVLRLDENTSDELTSIRAYLRSGQNLSAVQLVYLLENPGELLMLGKYVDKASLLLSTLGDAKGEAAPRMTAALITDVSGGDADAVSALVAWLKEVIPANRRVQHSYIAVRLLLGLDASARKYDAPRIPRALLYCRRDPSFAGWWRVERGSSRNVTYYQRPKVDNLDL